MTGHLKNTMTARESAEYVGCSSVDQFRREVGQGIWPAPVAPNSRPQRWSRPALDAVLSPISSSSRVLSEEDKLNRDLGLA